MSNSSTTKTGKMLEIIKCSVLDCDRNAHNVLRELCNMHYQREFKQGSLRSPEVCSFDQCGSVESFRGICKSHRHLVYPQFFHPAGTRYGTGNFDSSGNVKKCSIVRCEELSEFRGRCRRHYQILQRGVKSPNRDAEGFKVVCSSRELCDREAVVNGFCRKHNERFSRSGSETLKPLYEPCPVPGCDRRKVVRGLLCKKCNQFRWRFSLTPEEVIRLHLPENRVCSNLGCGSKERLHLDHDHSCCATGSLDRPTRVSCGECVRGWLCSPCNTSLGQLQENPQKIRGLLEFLEKFQD